MFVVVAAAVTVVLLLLILFVVLLLLLSLLLLMLLLLLLTYLSVRVSVNLSICPVITRAPNCIPLFHVIVFVLTPSP